MIFVVEYASILYLICKFANDRHFFNPRFFVDDGWSGAKFNRPGLNEMLAEVRAGQVAKVEIFYNFIGQINSRDEPVETVSYKIKSVVA